MHVDSWALKAKKFGYRTRAVFKLDEIIQKTKVLKKSKYVINFCPSAASNDNFLDFTLQQPIKLGLG